MFVPRFVSACSPPWTLSGREEETTRMGRTAPLGSAQVEGDSAGDLRKGGCGSGLCLQKFGRTRRGGAQRADLLSWPGHPEVRIPKRLKWAKGFF